MYLRIIKKLNWNRSQGGQHRAKENPTSSLQVQIWTKDLSKGGSTETFSFMCSPPSGCIC